MFQLFPQERKKEAFPQGSNVEEGLVGPFSLTHHPTPGTQPLKTGFLPTMEEL